MNDIQSPVDHVGLLYPKLIHPPFQIGPGGEFLLPWLVDGRYYRIANKTGEVIMATPEEIEMAKEWEPQPDVRIN